MPNYKPATVGIPALFNATENGKIAINDERVLLAGLVADEATKQSILKEFTDWGSLRVIDQIKVKPPVAAPKLAPTLVWNQKDPKKVVLEGRVPDQGAIDSLVKSAKQRVGPNGKVVNKLKIVENVKSEPWLSSVPVFAAQSLPKVKGTEIRIDENTSYIAGVVASSTTMNDVSVAFSGIDPPGKLDVNLTIVEPKAPEPVAPVREKIPELRVKGIGNTLTASGNMPFTKGRKEVLSLIHI